MDKTIKNLTSPKKDFNIKEGESVTLVMLQTSAILRIADATESMAKNFADLQDKYLYQKDRADRYHSKVLELERSNAAYRGHITRYKNFYEAPDSKVVKEMTDLVQKNYQLSSENQRLTESSIVLHREYQELYTQLQISKSNDNVKDSQ